MWLCGEVEGHGYESAGRGMFCPSQFLCVLCTFMLCRGWPYFSNFEMGQQPPTMTKARSRRQPRQAARKRRSSMIPPAPRGPCRSGAAQRW
jgi:hypothetical protein